MPGYRVPALAPEQRVVHRRIICPVLPADAEGNDVLDFIGERRQTSQEPGGSVYGEVRADRSISAGDIETNAHDRDLFAVSCNPADRHDVALVAVGHERRALGPARHVAHLGERPGLVLTEDVKS